MIQVVTLYYFQHIDKPYLIKAKLSDWCESQDVKGTLIIAHEGVNGTLSGRRDILEGFICRLQELLGNITLPTKWSTAKVHPFGKLKFPLKPEIVTMGSVKPNPLKRVGTYVRPENWNELILRDDVQVVDTRNHYEVALGTFEGSVDPKTAAFRDFSAWVEQNLDPSRDKSVAMFCTGGIRCEKATSHLLEKGFESVYHLEGGILRYLEVVPESESLWRGECFVFDDRVSLNHGLVQGTAVMCNHCGRPVATADQKKRPELCPSCGAELEPYAS